MRYANNHKWVKSVNPEILPDFGKNDTKKLQSFFNTLDSRDISHEFKILDAAFFDWFKPLYDSKVATKDNFHGQDIMAKTIGKSCDNQDYYTLTITENGATVGGLIYSKRSDHVSVVYRTFDSRWADSPKERCGPALYAEYLLAKQTLDLKLNSLVHGSDRNPYGLNSSIGLAIFKLSTGCHPELQQTHDVLDFDLQSCDKDVLVLSYPEDGKIITTATLATTEEDLPKYDQLFKYPNKLKITTVMRKN